MIFPGDTEHIIWRTKLLSRSELPGEALGQPERSKIAGCSPLWAPQLPGWNYTPWDPANLKVELISVWRGNKKKTHPPSLQGTASHLLAGCREVFLSLGIKRACHPTPTSLPRLSSAPSPCNMAASDPREPSRQARRPHFQRDEVASPRSPQGDVVLRVFLSTHRPAQ